MPVVQGDPAALCALLQNLIANAIKFCEEQPHVRVSCFERDEDWTLVVEDKTERVYRYAKSIEKEIGVIAHSCGVPEPRRLKRFHCRVVQPGGLSVALDELYGDDSY